MNQKTAILVFAQSASLESKNKYFSNGVQLFDALNEQIVSKVKKTGLTYFVISEKEQIGNSFAERFTNAISFIFNKGFSNIIAVGNDSPELNTQHLQQALLNLKESKTTIGPSLDGGFYLLAFHKNQFDKTAFLNLPWQKQSLRKELVKILNFKKANISTLSYLNDLDGIDDINYYLSHKNTISKEIFRLLNTFTPLTFHNNIFIGIEKTYINTHYNKGSPIVS